MRTPATVFLLIAAIAVVLSWQHRARPPAALGGAGTAPYPYAPAPHSAADVVATQPHRSGAMRSVRGALADGGAPRAATAPPLSEQDATSGKPDARMQRETAPVASKPAAEHSVPLADPEPATAHRTSARASAATALRPDNAGRTATGAAPARATAAATDATDAAPKPAADLFDPLIGDDPNRVFAPATANYHAAVQGETADPDWGPAAAAALRDYIVGLFGDRFEIPYVDCRRDLCELQVASRPGGDAAQDLHDLGEAFAHLRQQPWWNALEFDQENGTTVTTADGRVASLWFFSRR